MCQLAEPWDITKHFFPRNHRIKIQTKYESSKYLLHLGVILVIKQWKFNF